MKILGDLLTSADLTYKKAKKMNIDELFEHLKPRMEKVDKVLNQPNDPKYVAHLIQYLLTK